MEFSGPKFANSRGHGQVPVQSERERALLRSEESFDERESFRKCSRQGEGGSQIRRGEFRQVRFFKILYEVFINFFTQKKGDMKIEFE